jgi:hypothetical protein
MSKTKLVLELLQNESTLAEIARKHNILPQNLVNRKCSGPLICSGLTNLDTRWPYTPQGGTEQSNTNYKDVSK